ncbi:BglG family transcription antiterminator [Peribacillus sp. SCS-37]|uniref:BglG family transcription antiterminator n=1 Tax=Paraperibacillus esterisolvens TaxID=3115296 RepID=UPI0039067B15
MRMTSILRELMGTKSCVTGEDLAAAIEVTSRTIRNDIKELDALISKHGGSILSKRGTGYQLIIEDEARFLTFLKANIYKGLSDSTEIPSMPEERVQYLIKRLLLAEGFLKLEELADDMYISKSTIQNDLRDVKRILGAYGIYMEKRPNYGIRLKGEEVKLRYCMAEYVFNREGTHPDIHKLGVSILTQEEMQIIKEIILLQIKNNEISLSDMALNNLVIHIAIAFKRIQNRNYVSLAQGELQEIFRQKEYEAARKIIEDIQNRLSVIFPEEEVAYIAIHLLGTRTLISGTAEEEAEAMGSEDGEIRLLTGKIIAAIEENLLPGISGDRELAAMLSLHLKPVVYRFRYGMNLRNPMLQQIKANYPIAFEGGIIASMVIKEELDIEINEHEIGYIALHIGAAIERRTMTQLPKNCLIVCASGLGSAQLLSYKLQTVFGNKLNIIGTIEFYKLHGYPLSAVDLIISTIPIADSMPVPVIEVNTFLGSADFQKIEELLKPESAQQTKYTREDLVFLQRKFESREEVLSFLAEELKERGLAGEGFFESVMERESFSATSFGNLVAIPHPAVPMTDSTFWAVVTLQKPIQWGNSRVQFVCLLCIRKNSTEDYKAMYGQLAEMIDNTSRVQQLLKCKTYKDFEKFI